MLNIKVFTPDQFGDLGQEFYLNQQERGGTRKNRRLLERLLSGVNVIEVQFRTLDFPEAVVKEAVEDFLRRLGEEIPEDMPGNIQLTKQGFRFPARDPKLMAFADSFRLQCYIQPNFFEFCPLQKRVHERTKGLFSFLKSDVLGLGVLPRFRKGIAPWYINGLSLFEADEGDPTYEFFTKFKAVVGFDDYTWGVYDQLVTDCLLEFAWIFHSDYMSYGEHSIVVKDGKIDADWLKQAIGEVPQGEPPATDGLESRNWNKFHPLYLCPFHAAYAFMQEDEAVRYCDNYEDSDNKIMMDLTLPGKPSFELKWEVENMGHDTHMPVVLNFRFTML